MKYVPCCGAYKRQLLDGHGSLCCCIALHRHRHQNNHFLLPFLQDEILCKASTTCPFGLCQSSHRSERRCRDCRRPQLRRRQSQRSQRSHRGYSSSPCYHPVRRWRCQLCNCCRNHRGKGLGAPSGLGCSVSHHSYPNPFRRHQQDHHQLDRHQGPGRRAGIWLHHPAAVADAIYRRQ